jgi:hypothetical protein
VERWLNDLKEGGGKAALAVGRSHVAAARQIMGPAGHEHHRWLPRFLALVPDTTATAELARLAVFSPDRAARAEAVRALTHRRERDSTPVLLAAMRYPWPEVARNAAEAIVKMGRTDLMPALVGMLEEADPRTPRPKRIGGREVHVTRELVRIHHHKSCLLCHAPAPEELLDEALRADIPSPTMELERPTPPAEKAAASRMPAFGGLGYFSPGFSAADVADAGEWPLSVRIDVTYLRQDFSAMLPVKDHGVWPEEQRFDFVVRERVLTRAEADELRRRMEKREPGALTPYQKAAVWALRELSGRDLEAKAEVWRKYLKTKSP